MIRLIFACLFISFSLTGCTILPSNIISVTPPNVATNLLISEENLTEFNWVANRVSATVIAEQSEVLYAPPAPSYTYALTSHLMVTSGLGTPSVHQIIAGAKQYHSYRMTAVLQGYEENASVSVRFARTLDKSAYPDAEYVVAVGKGVKRITFEFFLPENTPSFIFGLTPKVEVNQFIDIGEIRVWDSTPNLVTDKGDPGCQLFPSNHFWNVPVDDWATHPNSNNYLRGLRNGENLVKDGYFLRFAFGARSYRNSPVGMPYNVVTKDASPPEAFGVRLKFVSFGDSDYPPASPFDAFRDSVFRYETIAYPFESDDVIYPIPTDMFVQGIPQSGVIDVSSSKGYPTDSSGYPDPAIDPDVNKDWPGLILQKGTTSKDCDLYEIYKLTKIEGQPFQEAWRASSAAYWDLRTNIIEGKRGREFLTSVSASGLPLLPSLVRYNEIEDNGEIRHALGMNARSVCNMVWPARHIANTASGQCVPLGLRLRLKPTFLNNSRHMGCNINSFSKEGKAIIIALQRYGSVIVDSGPVSLTVIGTHDSRWGPPVDLDGHNIGGVNNQRNYDISNEVYSNNCWPRVEDFEVVDTDRYAHWSFAQDSQGNALQSQIYGVYNNRAVYDSMAVYGE